MSRISNIRKTFFVKIVATVFLVEYMSFCPMSLAQVTKNNLTPETILEHVFLAKKELPAMAADMVINSTLSRGNETQTNRYVSRYRKDGMKIDVVADTHYSDIALSEDQVTSQTRSIWDGKTFANRYRNIAVDSLPQYAVSSQVERGKNISLKVWAAPWANGIVTGDYQPAEQIMKQSKQITLAPEMEDINGFLCYLIESETERGHYKLWVDPKHEFVVRKILVRREGDDLNWDKPVGNTTIELEINNVDIQRIDGHYVVTESILKEKGVQHNKVIFDDTYRVKVSNIKLNPDFEKMRAFEMDGIPEGAKVTHLDYLGIRYIWYDGRAIVDVDLDVLDDIDMVIKENTVYPRQSKTEEPDIQAPINSLVEQIQGGDVDRIRLNNSEKLLKREDDNKTNRKIWWFASILIIPLSAMVFFLRKRMLK